MRSTSSMLNKAAWSLAVTAVSYAAFPQSVEFPVYTPVRQVSGVIRTWGSPQMSDLLKRYEDGFRKVQPAVQFEDSLKSTTTAVAGVYAGRADIGLLGREIWPAEVQAFSSIEGRTPFVVDVATGSFDVPKATFALMVFVPRENPITRLSTEQLEKLFGNRKEAIKTWGDLGLHGAWAKRSVHLYGFNIDNDKSQIFSQLVFKPGERWSPTLHEFGNTTLDAGELIIHAVAADQDGIGISNVHYATSAVRALALSRSAHSQAVTPTRENVVTRAYPLTRAVYMVINRNPDRSPTLATLEFLRFVLSRQGRDAVLQEGNYLPLTPEIAASQLGLLTAAP